MTGLINALIAIVSEVFTVLVALWDGIVGILAPNRDEDVPDSRSRTVGLIARFMLGYALFATFLTLLPTIAALLFLIIDPRDSLWGMFALLALYGAGSAATMYKAQLEMRRRGIRATLWTRVAMTCSIPGSILIGVPGAFVLVAIWAGPWASNLTPELVVWGLVGSTIAGGIVLASLANLAVLIRVLFTDLDDLLWANEVQRARLPGELEFDE